MVNVVGDSALPSAFGTRAQAVVTQVDKAVLHQKGFGSGLTINLPEGSHRIHPGYNGNYYHFVNTSHAHGTHWRDFLAHLPPFIAVVAHLPEDWGDQIFAAHPLEIDVHQPAFVDSVISPSPGEPDVDFFQIEVPAGVVLYADISGDPANGGLVPILTVYAPDGDTVLAQAVGNDEGAASLKALDLPRPGSYYLAVTSVGNFDPLNPTENETFGSYSLTLVCGDPVELTPRLVVEPAYVFFGEVVVGSWDSSRLLLANEGGTDLEITSIELPEWSVFRAPNAPVLLPVQLGAGGRFELDVGMKPDRTGPIVETLTLVSTDPNQPAWEVVLEVVGIPDPCPGDPDDDGDVDGSALVKVAADLGSAECYGYCDGDMNGDDRVDRRDVLIFSEHFGRAECLLTP